ncbi:hypothetical protein D9756_005618 [Leucocoprinus leucothites]|uniref:U3 small nucleolar RNA-associated protein 20 n=1 Tax=Leucocoprinus leucothites TaxID=201217 RepID=A0A8H5FZM6_9AGAR|nr:hypothetical protein D9756_005618 [Leucoagaricus leucothites]
MSSNELDHEIHQSTKRFKHQSYTQSLKDVHLPSAFTRNEFEREIGDNESHFHESLEHWKQLNLAPSFITFANHAGPLSLSMPLLLHHWKEIVGHWEAAMDSTNDEGLRALLDLMQKLAHDLRTTLSPIYPSILKRLLKLLPRALEPAALTVLLETFSSLFRYLLVPSIHLELLTHSWNAVSSILPKCLPEIQRAVAEVWGSVLRRLKSASRDHAVKLLAENAEGLEDASAWAIVFASKSISQTLHTSTVPLFTPLLAWHISAEDPEATFTVLRRSLTALVHHVKTADQFSALGELLIRELKKVLDEDDGTDSEKLRRVLEVVSIPYSVRQGSRMTQAHHTTLFALSQTLPLNNRTLHPALLKLISALFIASDTSLWLGPGLKFLQQAWSSPSVPSSTSPTSTSSSTPSVEFALRLHSILADLNWGGWKLVALPLLLKATRKPENLDADPQLIIDSLAGLVRARKLNVEDVDVVWKENWERWLVDERLALLETQLQGGDAVAAEIDNILAFSPFMSHKLTTKLIGFINTELQLSTNNSGDVQIPSLEADDNDIVLARPAWILGTCMKALQHRDHSEWATKVDICSWIRSGTRSWGTVPEVVSGLAPLARTSTSSKPIPLDEIYPHLRAALISHSRVLRLNAMRLMDSKLVSAPGGVQEVMKRCLQGEEVSIDVQGVRERVLRIGRVVQVVGDAEGADFCARWLIAQLKVNLRPLWSPAAAALSALSQRFGDVVWDLMFAEIQRGEDGNQGTRDSRFNNTQAQGEGDERDDIWEDERSWRDPSAHKLRVALSKWLDSEHRIKELIKESSMHDRLDPLSYQHQLLMAVGECHSLAEKHNRDIVTYFLSLTSSSSSRLPKQKLTSWLTLFSKFSNPKALHSTDTLRTFYVAHLSYPDRSIQSLALTCLFTYKSPHLAYHEEKIRLLLDDTRWRDELTLLEIGSIEQEDREDVVGVIVRLLFGLMVERRGRARGGDRRAAVLAALAGCTDDELGLLVDLMLKSLGLDRHAHQKDNSVFSISEVPGGVTDKQMVGYLTLLGDVLKNLGSRLVPYWPALLGSTIDILASSQKRLSDMSSDGVEGAVEGEGAAESLEEEADEKEDAAAPSTSAGVVRTIRQLGLKRFTDFFKCPVTFDFDAYIPPAFDAFILPRISNLDRENTQAPSALMDVFYAWSLRSEYCKYLVQRSDTLLPKIYDCLVAVNVKPTVIIHVFDIAERVLVHAASDETVRDTVLKPHASKLLDNLALLVERVQDVATVATPIGQRQISILSEIAQYSENASQATTLLSLFIPLLRKPAKFVPEKVKVDLLKILANLMSLIPDLRNRQSDIYVKTYDLFSQLFQSLRSRASRISLVNAFNQLASLSDTQYLATLLADLNAYSAKRIDEPDFDRRLAAFARLNETNDKRLSPLDWAPILHNSLFCIQDTVELAMRNNAAFSMKHFIDLFFSRREEDGAYEDKFMKLLFPGLKNGLRSKNELVRAEVLNVIAYAVGKLDFISLLKDMQLLLEALRRLGDHCDEGHLRSSTLSEIFIPLVGNYIASTTAVDHHLVTDAIAATGRMAKQLSWSAYYALVQRYIKLSKVKDESERVYVRALVAVLDNFHFPMNEALTEADKEEEDEGEMEDTIEQKELHKPTGLSASQVSRIADAVNLRLLPALLGYLEKHDATTDDNTRIPISVGIVTVAKHLPDSAREAQITRLLTILSQILRSRSQETRDLTRDAIVRISASLGPQYLPLVFRELRGALARGPQLHVLAFVTHSVLARITSAEHADSFKALDDCVNDVAHVSAEVIFGESGKNVLSEDFKTKMREVRGSSSRGLDSFAMIAKVISPNKISSLLAPLRAIMQETESLKVMQLVDEVLKRIASGLNSNQNLPPAELIVLCHTLISQNARFLKQTVQKKKPNPKRDAIVQLKREVAVDTDHYVNNSFRFVALGLDLFNTALRRSRFDFHDAETIKRLESMVVVIGNSLYSTNASVVILSLKCTAGLTKCPLKTLSKSVPVFVSQMVDTIRQAGSTESEIVQVAFRSLATILRDFPGAQVKEKDLIFLLELLTPDLEDHERQAAVFTMLRAIVARKFVVPEIYDIMEKVGEIMVTSQSPQVQELCRGVLLQFLLDYPQGKGRLRNQMAFLAKNLSYVHESGRKSVMELLSAIITKFQDALIYEYTDLLFVALVMVIANDDSPKCREMSAQLIKNLYSRLDDERKKLIFSHLHTWATQDARIQLVWVSAQICGFIVDAAQVEIQPYVGTMMEDLRTALVTSAKSLIQDEEDDDEDDASMEVDLEWKVPYHSLTVLFKVLRIFPDFCTQDAKVSWNLVTSHLLYPHAWVRTAACRLLGLLFNALPTTAPRTDLPDDHPASLAGMQEIAKKLSLQLKSVNLDEVLSIQVVKNLFFVGKCFCAMPKASASTGSAELPEALLDDDTGDQNVEDVAKRRDPLPWLFSKLSYQVKSAQIARRSRTKTTANWHQQPLAALRWFAAMTSYMDVERVEQFLVHILTPVYRLTEDDTIRDAQMEEVKTTAIELRDLVQAKVGTTKFSNVYNQIRQKTLELRRNRKVERTLQVTTNPEAAAKRKLQRNTIKKESRKRKDRSFAESRGKFKKRRND